MTRIRGAVNVASQCSAPTVGENRSDAANIAAIPRPALSSPRVLSIRMQKESDMPLNHYVTLGRSGLRVSPLCLGAMTFGKDWGWGSDIPESCRIMDAYIDRGGNFIDTANIYTKGHSEAIIGEHIGRDRAKRDRVIIATKFMGNLYLGDPNGGGASR